jgi:hypothetical protein
LGLGLRGVLPQTGSPWVWKMVGKAAGAGPAAVG